MSNPIRVFSLDDNDTTAVQLRKLHHDDSEVTRWTRPSAKPGALVVDVISPGGYRSTTFDVGDLIRNLREAYPEEFAKLVTGQLEPDEAVFAELVQLNREVQNIIRVAEQVARGDDESIAWTNAYDQVFSARYSVRIRALFHTLACRFEYYDPDTTYQEDVTSYARALRERIEQLGEHYPAVPVR